MPRAASHDPIYRRRRYTPELIELCVRWYVTYRLSYRDPFIGPSIETAFTSWSRRKAADCGTFAAVGVAFSGHRSDRFRGRQSVNAPDSAKNWL